MYDRPDLVISARSEDFYWNLEAVVECSNISTLYKKEIFEESDDEAMWKHQLGFDLQWNDATEEFCQNRTRVAYPVSSFLAARVVAEMKGVPLWIGKVLGTKKDREKISFLYLYTSKKHGIAMPG